MFLAFLTVDLKSPFYKGYSVPMGYSLCKTADFQNCPISRIFGVFSSGFFAQDNSNLLVEWFFACFCLFYVLTQTDHFAEAIAFARWPIFKFVSYLEYLASFKRFFAQNNCNVLLELFFACFWLF